VLRAASAVGELRLFYYYVPSLRRDPIQAVARRPPSTRPGSGHHPGQCSIIRQASACSCCARIDLVGVASVRINSFPRSSANLEEQRTALDCRWILIGRGFILLGSMHARINVLENECQRQWWKGMDRRTGKRGGRRQRTLAVSL
jgi:hypothetical protein